MNYLRSQTSLSKQLITLSGQRREADKNSVGVLSLVKINSLKERKLLNNKKKRKPQ